MIRQYNKNSNNGSNSSSTGNSHGNMADGLSRYTPDLWLTCKHFVGKVTAMGQPTRQTQPSIPLGSVNE